LLCRANLTLVLALSVYVHLSKYNDPR
jgi:hypothetical protein